MATESEDGAAGAPPFSWVTKDLQPRADIEDEEALSSMLDERDVTLSRGRPPAQVSQVGKLVAHESRVVPEDDAYGRARTAALAHLDRGFHLGGAVPDRDNLQER